jgi:hypothetical protein
MTTWVVGDIHGCYETAMELLRNIGCVDDKDSWAGGSNHLWFIGDLTDRGPLGIESIDLVMKLQRQATEAGGSVGCLLGNHEILLLGARRFLDTQIGETGADFLGLWLMNGGKPRDLESLTADHLAWLSALPAVAKVGRYLLIHADAGVYAGLGSTIEEANTAVGRILASPSILTWEELLTAFVRRRELDDSDPQGAESLDRLFEVFGGEVVVHGHTPIPVLRDVPAAEVSEPLVYSGGRCINIDGGMFLGSPGVALELRL